MQDEVDIDLDNVQGRIAEFIVQPAVERKVCRVFVNFLLTYEDEEGNKIYQQRIKDMQSGESAAAGRASMKVFCECAAVSSRHAGHGGRNVS